LRFSTPNSRRELQRPNSGRTFLLSAAECSVAHRHPINTRLPKLWVGGTKIPQQLPDWRIGEPAAIVDILHVTLAIGIEFVKQRVALPVEDQLPDAEPLAHLRIERRRHLELPAVKLKRDITMVDEQIGIHQLRELWRIQMIADIGKPDRSGDAAGAEGGSQKDRLRHAIV
jgi:hypothetical protein